MYVDISPSQAPPGRKRGTAWQVRCPLARRCLQTSYNSRAECGFGGFRGMFGNVAATLCDTSWIIQMNLCDGGLGRGQLTTGTRVPRSRQAQASSIPSICRHRRTVDVACVPGSTSSLPPSATMTNSTVARSAPSASQDLFHEVFPKSTLLACRGITDDVPPSLASLVFCR